MTVTFYSRNAPADAQVERQVRVSLAKRNFPFFIQHYLRTDEGEPFDLADFHVEWAELCSSDEEKVLVLGPAAHGKTTIFVRAYATWLATCFPNVRVKLGAKNMDTAAARLLAVKTELESNERLIEDFGPFVSDLWRHDRINVRQRTVRDIEPTIQAFGSETTIMGSRATHLLLDDYVTEENSGAHVEERTRAKLSTNFSTTLKKLGYPGRKLYIRWVNTVVDLRDLVHVYANVNGAMPEDNRPTWRSTRGFKVWRRPSIDETTGDVLWPKIHTREELEAERTDDVMAFLKRMQNRCLDPSMMEFRREWFYGDQAAIPPLPGCLDYDRVLGQAPHLPAGAHATLAGGYDPNPGTSENSKYCAYAELGFDRLQGEPRTYAVTALARFRDTLPKQEAFIVAQAMGRGTALILIEANVANQWLLQLPNIQGAVKSGFRIEPHYTSVKNKPDPDTGVPSLAGMIRGGLLRFPYGDAQSRAMTELAISEFLSYPEGATSDMVMSIWFAILAAKKVAIRKGLRTYGGVGNVLSRLAPTLAAIERHFPTMASPIDAEQMRAAKMATGPLPEWQTGDVRRGGLDGD
jgi:hypothetical protein